VAQGVGPEFKPQYCKKKKKKKSGFYGLFLVGSLTCLQVSFFSFWGGNIGIWPQRLMLAKWVICHLSHAPSMFLL
jgi:hypothetical protein